MRESPTRKKERLAQYRQQLLRAQDIAEKRIGHFSLKRARIRSELDRLMHALPKEAEAL